MSLPAVAIPSKFALNITTPNPTTETKTYKPGTRDQEPGTEPVALGASAQPRLQPVHRRRRRIITSRVRRLRSLQVLLKRIQRGNNPIRLLPPLRHHRSEERRTRPLPHRPNPRQPPQ